MLRYTFRRLLIAIPTILLISVLVFLLGQHVTDDVVFARGGTPYTGASIDPDAEAAYTAQQAANLHLDKPNFYFSIHLSCLPDSLYKIQPLWRRDKLRAMALQIGAWPPVEQYEKQLASVIKTMEALPDSLLDRTAANSTIALLKTATNPIVCDTLLTRLSQNVRQPDAMITPLKQCLRTIQPTAGLGMPTLSWHGKNNQYHDWLTRRYAHEAYSPWKKLDYPLRVTLFLNVVALLGSFLIAIPVGVYSASHKKADRYTKRALMFLYFIPVLLAGCGLRFLFATPGHGLYLSSIGGVGTTVYDASSSTFWHWLVNNKGRLVLPIITQSIHVIALVALQMRSGMIDIGQQDFIRTARAKGLPERIVLWRHTVRNALFPIIVLIGHLIPAIVSGSILTELIFNINGLGSITLDSVMNQDHILMMTIVLMVTILTIAGSLIADLLLAWADPRVRAGFEDGRI